MSEPRHAAIYKDCEKDKWFLEIVPYDLMKEQDAYSNNAEQFGFFDTPEEAEQYAENNFQNTGFGIPILDQLEFVVASSTIHLMEEDTA